MLQTIKLHIFETDKLYNVLILTVDFIQIMDVIVGKLKRYGVIYNREVTSLSKFVLLKSREAFRQNPPHRLPVCTWLLLCLVIGSKSCIALLLFPSSSCCVHNSIIPIDLSKILYNVKKKLLNAKRVTGIKHNFSVISNCSNCLQSNGIKKG